jgi:hypothetical protein
MILSIVAILRCLFGTLVLRDQQQRSSPHGGRLMAAWLDR